MRAISNQQGAMDGPGSACRTFAVSTLGSLIVALATGACVAFATGASATAGSDSIELLNNTNPSGAAIALDRTTQDRQPSGNPLWAIPLRALTVTRDRPIFSPSRRPPAPAVIAAPAPLKQAPPPEPERPALTLVGTIVGGGDDDESIGVFTDQATQAVVRIKVGQTHQGWQLRSVRISEASFDRNGRTVVLALPSRTRQPIAERPNGSAQRAPGQ